MVMENPRAIKSVIRKSLTLWLEFIHIKTIYQPQIKQGIKENLSSKTFISKNLFTCINANELRIPLCLKNIGLKSKSIFQATYGDCIWLYILLALTAFVTTNNKRNRVIMCGIVCIYLAIILLVAMIKLKI